MYIFFWFQNEKSGWKKFAKIKNYLDKALV